MSRILNLVAWRFVTAVATLLFISVLIFWSVEVLPGDVARRILGQWATEQQVELLRERLHLNDPLGERYVRWLSGAIRGDFGESLSANKPIAQLMVPRLRNTLILSAMAFALYVPFTVVLSTVAALSRDRPLDRMVQAITLLGFSVPEFVQATLLLIAFGVIIPIFPVRAMMQNVGTAGGMLRMLLLPAVTLTINMSVYAIRMLRDNLIEVLDSDYVRMATLKGLPAWRIGLRHALPNAIVPALNITALNLTWLVGGVVLIERVFAFPGVGSLLVDAVALQDAPLVEATVLLATAVYIAGNLLADVAAILLNPKSRSG